ncbi:hypothetical protein [Desulfovibrio litoralis]|uniref:Uncharacterized protein n=1 Tax=Desulfovibrio litoralis DSM 11393 TaxID=1121455 RepID=A0A1M7T7H0_9BACT|nr:hypothetical protein [Desulfovibrio litoralis]SHN66659.1 hypothetical protein SAMN02745728_01670 [Desulfovibrio litoralis DSM 11393]
METNSLLLAKILKNALSNVVKKISEEGIDILVSEIKDENNITVGVFSLITQQEAIPFYEKALKDAERKYEEAKE